MEPSATPPKQLISVGVHPKLNRLPHGATKDQRSADKARMNAGTAKGWQRRDFTLDELASYLDTGASIAAVFTDGHRHTESAQAQFIAVDFDKNDPDRALIEADARALGCAVIIGETATAGHYRAITILAEPQTDSERFKDIASRVIHQFCGATDPAGVVISQPWYGFQKGTVTTLQGEPLTIAAIMALPAPPQPETPPITFEKRERAAISSEGDPDWDAERAIYWHDVVLQALPPVVKRQSNREYRHCPFPARHTHNDKDASFRISFDKNPEGSPVCSCGIQHERNKRGMLAEAVGAPDFMTWWRDERAPLFKRLHHAKTESMQAVDKLPTVPRPFLLEAASGDITVSLRYVSDIPADLLPTSGGLIVRSPIGTGKTRLAARLIARIGASLGRSARVLVITHRQALAHDLTDRLNAEGLHFECYKGLTGGDLRRIDRLVICANSAPKLIAGIGAALPIYDIVIIDESEQVLDHFGGATFRKGEAITAHETVRGLVSGAGLVLAMDAHAGTRTCAWLREMGKQTRMLVNTYMVERGALTIYDTREALISTANQLIDEQTGPVIIPVSSRKEAKRLERYFTDRLGAAAVYMICSENSESFEAQAFIRAINDRLPALRVFIYTASLGTGVDITCPVRAVCGVFGVQPLSAPELHQMIGRCRNTRETHVFIKPAEGHTETSSETIYTRYVENALRTKKVIQISSGVVSLSEEQQRLTRLLSACEADRNRSANNLRGHFVALAFGYVLAYAESGDNEVLRLELVHVGEVVSATEKQAVLIADPVSYQEYDQKQQMGGLTPADRAGLERYRIEDHSGQTITPALYDDLHTPADREKLTLFTDLADTHAHVLEADRGADLDNIPMTRLKHRARKRQVGRRLLRDVFGEKLNTEIELTAEQIDERMKDFLEIGLDELRRLYGWRSDQSDQPVAVLRWVVEKRYGLKLKSRQIRVGNGERVRVYSLDSEHLAKMGHHARCRLTHLERQRAEREAALEGVSNHGDIYACAENEPQPAVPTESPGFTSSGGAALLAGRLASLTAPIGRGY